MGAMASSDLDTLVWRALIDFCIDDQQACLGLLGYVGLAHIIGQLEIPFRY